MEKMIEILKIKKDKKRFIVYTNDGEYKFTEDTIVSFMVLKGKTFSEKEFKKIVKANCSDELFNKALNYISYQMRSEYEIYSYLKEKEASQVEIERIIKKIKDFGYIDDRALSKYLTDYVIRQKKGPKVLERKLQEKRIDEEIIKEVLSSYDFDKEIEVANLLMDSILKKNTDKPLKAQKMNAYTKLARDGFSGEVINHVINEATFSDNSLERIEKEIEKQEYKYRDLDDAKRREKMIASLLRKGYEYSIISRYLEK